MEPAETLAGLRLLHSNLLSNPRLGRLLSGNRIRPTELSGLPVSGFDGLRLSACDVASIRQLAGRSARPNRTDPAQALLAELTRQQVTVLGQWQPAYPRLLKEIADPPAMLFVKGNLSLLNGAALAVVGSRKATLPALRVTRSLTTSLAETGLTVVSGLARGVDTHALSGALPSGRAVAVIGTGINRYYPASNRELQRTLEQRGAVVSEFMPDAPPRAAHFPQRNRLISGLSVGTLVTEATLRSGSLITARCAADQGREVFAMPGSPDGEHNRGGHQLLREGATLVETPEDILTELDGHGLMKLAQHPVGQSRRSRAESESTAPAGAMDTLEAAVLRRISMSEHLPADLMRGENLSLSQMSTVLMRLELAGRIQRKGGRVYLRE